MCAVLGISGYYHDAAAALVVDGQVVAAIQEERLSRIKNDPSLPRRAALACLRRAGLTGADLDAVVVYENPFAKIERVLISLLRAFPWSIRQFPRAIRAQLGQKLAYCMEDTVQVMPGPNVSCHKQYDCSDQGIQAGWSDLYGNSLDCQWLDITDVPAGAYSLEVTVNPTRAFPEETFDNNTTTIPVTIP